MDNVEIDGAVAYSVSADGVQMDSGFYQGNYDGDTLNIVGTDQTGIVFASLSNEDIMDILAKPASRAGIEERIMDDYGPAEMRLTEIGSDKLLSRKDSKSKNGSKRRKRRAKRRTKRRSPKTPGSPVVTRTPVEHRKSK
jgi:hypothetical protein